MANATIEMPQKMADEIKAAVQDLVAPQSYGVLVRHPGFIDKLLPAEGYTYYPTDKIGHWICGPDRDPMRLDTEADAQALADDLTAKFGADRYRFTVTVLRLVPRWFILHPTRDSESVPIGSREQIL